MERLLYNYKKFRLRNLIARQDFNTPEFRILEILLKDRSTISVDAGACYGVYSVFMSKFCKRVISCEPIPLSCRLLTYQLEKNEVQNVDLHQLALSDTAGTVTMTVPATGSGLSRNYYRAEVSGQSQSKTLYGNSQSVKSITLDKLLEGEEDCSVIKIDVEGHEKEVLEGSIKTIEKRSPALLIEFNEPPVPKNKAFSIRTALEKSGYICFYQGDEGKFYRWTGKTEPAGVNYYFLTEVHLDKSGDRLKKFLSV